MTWSQLNVQGQGPIYVNEVSEQGFFAVTPRRMRTTRNADGSRKFSRDEWLTKGQVQSFFSRLSAISRNRGVTRAENVESDDEGDLLLHEEMARVLLTNVETRRFKIFLTRWA